MGQRALDAAIQTYYAELFDEDARLTTRSAAGRLEHARTQAIVRAATPAPARILDVGGGTGRHAAPLARDGYAVVLVDPVASQVAHAAAYGTFEARVGDARSLDEPDDSFDAVLLAGPLYHLSAREDRLLALREAVRVCRPGGVVHAAAIPRFVRFAAVAVHPAVLERDPEPWLRLLLDGTAPPVGRFPGGHFHTADELTEELTEARLRDVRVVGLEGPAALALEDSTDVSDEVTAAAATLAEAYAEVPDVRETSNHMLATGWV